MRRLPLLAVLAVMGFTQTATAARIKIVAPQRAPQYEGSIVAVRGRAQVLRDGNLPGTEVRLIGEGGKTIFVGFIPKLNEYAFPGVAGLDGREVVMFGVIEMYYATPATQLIYRSQLQSWPPVSK